MKIWLVEDGEILPLQKHLKVMRVGMLAEELSSRGHEVTWWAANFSHQEKKIIAPPGTHHIAKNYDLELLDCGTYMRNISLARFVHHRKLGLKFREISAQKEKPDLIVCGYPVPSFAREALKFGLKNNIKVVTDVRDYWPDIFISKVPWILKPCAKIVMILMEMDARFVFKNSTKLIAMSHGILRWAYKKASKTSQPSDDQIFYLGYKKEILEPRACPRIEEVKKKIPKNSKVCLYFGTFGYSYDVELLLQAAKELHKKENSDYYFILGGAGHKFSKIESEAKNLPNISVLSWLDKFEIDALLKLGHVGLVPCISEPDSVPNKPFAYLSEGLPILSSLVGEMEEIIDRYQIGASYPVGNLKIFLEKLDFILENNRFEKLRANATKFFETKASFEIIYSSFANYLEAIAKGE